jgi:isoleucyl-tRNA synthetase
MFKKDKRSLPEIEKTILEFWKEHHIFKKSLENRKDHENYVFYDGPPFATGLPHYGHILAGTIKDVVARYKTMEGFFVPRRFGWDCHGLPIENEIEKEHKFKSAAQIEEFGIARFNEECRKIVLRYSSEWRHTVEQMGRFVDFDETYHTMDLPFMESVWWVFGELWKKGLIYEGFKVMGYSPALGTPLSNFEMNLNYREVDDPSVTLKFRLQGGNTHLLVWTTTPWTLPSNLALALAPNELYVRIHDKDTEEDYILAKQRLLSYYKDENEYLIKEEFFGKELIGKSYEPLFTYFSTQKNSFKILAGDFVSLSDGTGIVHLAPAFGEDDFYLCQKAGIELVCPLDVNCNFTDQVKDFEGLFVKDADKEILRCLKGEGKIFQHTTIRHRYPYCWRTDKPLIYRAVTTWFVAVEKIKERMIENNRLIHWVPGHIKKGRFGNWLENARDWAISRNRYFGTPIPIWRSEDGDIRIISSIKELEERTQSDEINNIHRQYIDELTFEEDGKKFKRISEVFDCWFESGSMPYAQNHYPFENKEKTMKNFPADFIAEGLDQTRGWFYTLHVLSTALFDKPAFTHVIVNGIVLAEDGHKMSKRLKNYPEPKEVMEKLGADAVRLYLLHSPLVRGEDFNFSEKGVEGTLRGIIIPLWNCYAFLSTYASIYGWIPTDEMFSRPKADIDRWVLSKAQKLIGEVKEGMDSYCLDRAIEPISLFIEELTNWYIRRSRTRFWADENTQDRREAFETLYSVLLLFVKLSAPFIPFITEAIYQELRREKMPLSVHMTDFPRYDEEVRDLLIEKEMDTAQVVVNLGHCLRKEHRLKVRQPLSKVFVISQQADLIDALKRQSHLICEELNVKEMIIESDELKFVRYRLKPNFRVLGKKVGKWMNECKTAIDHLDKSDYDTLINGGDVFIPLGEDRYKLLVEDIELERLIQEGLVATTDEGIVVALETEITEELELEGIARELINRINTMRKGLDFDIVDRIEVFLSKTEKIEKALKMHKGFISHEVLAQNILFTQECFGEKVEINDEKIHLNISKIV